VASTLRLTWRDPTRGRGGWAGAAGASSSSSSSALVALVARFEAALHKASLATPDVSRALRLRQAASSSVQSCLYAGADAAEWTRTVFGKPAGGLMAPEAAEGAPLTRGGQPLAWCWETETYELASEVESVGRDAYERRKAAEAKRVEEDAWAAKKAAMSKRDLKKALQKEEKEREANAAAVAEAEAAAAAAPAAADKAEAERLALPDVQKEIAYAKQLEGAMRAAVEDCVDSFLDRAMGLEAEV
jgi:hypothetical protein